MLIDKAIQAKTCTATIEHDSHVEILLSLVVMIITSKFDIFILYQTCDQAGEKGKCRCSEQKRYEVPQISDANACAHPGTMVVMDLNTEVALRAMECSWRSHDIAAMTVTKFIFWICRFFFVNVLELQFAVKLLSIGRERIER